MPKATIPWHVFLDALAAQGPAFLTQWLERWRFNDGGVLLLEPEQPSDGPSRTAINDHG